MEINVLKTRIFQEGENLLSFLRTYLPDIPEKSILVITSKIVALSERRTVADVKAKTRLIKQESTWAMRTKYTWLTLKDNTLMAAAGIDESNANGKLILLPKNSFKTAQSVQEELKKIYKRRKIGVLITDSRLLPLRAGIIGVAVGYAGFRGVKDYRREKDIYGRPFQHTRVDVADSLAAAAVVGMGEGKERQPLALIRQAPVAFCEKVNPQELIIDPAEDMYRPFFQNLSSLSKKQPYRLEKHK